MAVRSRSDSQSSSSSSSSRTAVGADAERASPPAAKDKTRASASRSSQSPDESSQPPLPDEPVPGDDEEDEEDEEEGEEEEEGEVEGDAHPDAQPPLPNEPIPDSTNDGSDDGWQPVWDASANSYYFYNRFTAMTQWENPRVPEAPSAVAGPPPSLGMAATSAVSTTANSRSQRQTQYAPGTEPPPKSVAGGYNPAIHGDYDPNADYAQVDKDEEGQDTYALGAPPGLSGDDYSATASFNRYTGRFNNTALHPTHTPEQHTDDAKTRRHMNAFFDVDAAANAHGGRSLRAERQERKLTKKELRVFQERRKARKEEKRRAWLRD